jgi:hypothetical protein
VHPIFRLLVVGAFLATLGGAVLYLKPDLWNALRERLPLAALQAMLQPEKESLAGQPAQGEEIARQKPEEIAMDLDLRIRALRRELVGELRSFQLTYDYRAGGWGGGAGASKKLTFEEDEPEDAYWIGLTSSPKLLRARELQREIIRVRQQAAENQARLDRK